MGFKLRDVLRGRDRTAGEREKERVLTTIIFVKYSGRAGEVRRQAGGVNNNKILTNIVHSSQLTHSTVYTQRSRFLRAVSVFVPHHHSTPPLIKLFIRSLWSDLSM